MISMKILLLAIWIVLAILAYRVAKKKYTEDFSSWNNFNRVAAILICAIAAPYVLLTFLAMELTDRIANSKWGKREVKW